MSIDRISNGPLAPIDRSGGQGNSPAAIGEASARAVARAVIGRIAAELSIDGRPAPLPIDPYRLSALADAVARQFHDAEPAALGDLTRAIDALAGAIAADMAGAADGRTLERVDHALAGISPAGRGVDGVTEILDEAAKRVMDTR